MVDANSMAAKTRLVLPLMIFALVDAAGAAPPLNVGSKRFTESYILGEILRQTAQAAGETTANCLISSRVMAP